MSKVFTDHDLFFTLFAAVLVGLGCVIVVGEVVQFLRRH